MTELAAVSYLIALVYLANFFMLSLVAARDAGRSVWLLSRHVGAQRVTAAGFRISFAMALVWPALRMWTGGLGPGDPLTRLISGWTASLAGHFLVAVGSAVALLSQYHMGASWRVGAAPGELGPLVETGPFAFSRNPVFLGQAILLAGLALVFPDLIQWGAAILGIAAMLTQVRIEEGVLRETYGPAYAAYAARVPRWFGRVHGQRAED
jgi:protein-S-isoprenylcysteine O-methyltransferase Ste14